VIRDIERLAVLVIACLSLAATGAAQCLIPENLIISGGPGKDGIPALTNPEVVSASAGDSFLVPDDLVLGVVVNGEARAYPHGILWWHEITNDVLGGRPIVVSFCPLTGSGLVYDPVINEQLHNFGVSGLLFDNNLILFDRTTDSLWSQMGGQSICGSLRGARPSLLPVVQSTWAAWKTMHPDTTVVSFNTGFSRDYTRYPYGDYDLVDNTTLLFPQSTVDPRLPMKETVLGITHEGVARAYSMSRMSTVAPRLVINDNVNGLAVLVTFDAGSSLAVPFERRLQQAATSEGASSGEGELLEFEIIDEGMFPFKLRDRQTGSIWNLRGVAVEGPLAGARLRQIPTFSAFWFAWSAFNLDSQIHDPAASGGADEAEEG